VRDYLIGYRSNYQAGKRVAMETAATRDTEMIIIILRQRRGMIGNKSAYCPQNARLHIKRLMMVEPGKELIKQPCDDGWCQTLETVGKFFAARISPGTRVVHNKPTNVGCRLAHLLAVSRMRLAVTALACSLGNQDLLE
jgi:hypothetical protein